MTEALQKQAATLYKLPRFRTAFHNVILYSLRSNGYYDFHYISRSIKARGGDGETPSAAAGAVETGRV